MLVVAASAGSALGQTASFEPLPLPEGASGARAYSVSADGGTAVGVGWFSSKELDSYGQSVRWRADPAGVDVLVIQDYLSGVSATSAHGEVSVGTMDYAFESENWRGFAWGGGSDVAHFEWGSSARQVNHDGSIICGVTGGMTASYATVWVNGKPTTLPMPEWAAYSEAFDMSGRATLITGYAANEDSSKLQRLLWTRTEGGGYSVDEAEGGYSLSSDGSVTVGTRDFPGGWQGSLWRRNASPIPLGAGFAASDCSRRGGRVVGYSGSWPNYTAVLWTPQHGARPLRKILENDYGLDLTNWRLRNAAISDDGTVIVGYADVLGVDRAWRVVLPISCTSDWNFDGVVNSTDVSDFINEWFIEQSDLVTFAADVDDNGVVNSTDVSEYINGWFEDVVNCE